MSTNTRLYNSNLSNIFFLRELATLDTPLPIESFAKPDSDEYYSINELPNRKLLYSFDGAYALIGLQLRFLEADKDTIELALGDSLEYEFLGLPELDAVMASEIWTGVKDEQER